MSEVTRSNISVSTTVNPSHLIGHTITGLYPAANYHGIRPRLERRRILVESVRDTMAEPLDAITTELSPTLRRGRVLLTGLDLDKGAERSFYLDSLADLQLSFEPLSLIDEPSSDLTAAVAILPRPADWQPTSPDDLPPDVEVHREGSLAEARAFARRFNELEMKDPSGYWCVY